MSKYKTSFEYKDKDVETPFETFLKYTDEKVKSSEKLAEVFDKYIANQSISFLDIGTGNGEYLLKSLKKSHIKGRINLDLLEPSRDLVKELRNKLNEFPDDCSVNIVENSWEGFETDKKFDVILASHLYHIKRDQYYDQFKKMTGLLKKDGILIFVMRNIDDAYYFKMKFKSILFSEKFRAKTLDEALEIFSKLSDNIYPLKIEKYSSDSKLKIPLEANEADSISIIEFYLNKHWKEIPSEVQKSIWNYLVDKKGVLNQSDGIAVIRKKLT